ncbi:MAG: hypothetical protein IJD40_11365 [Lachnospiraceae bacterium]|nr:hypothetical protein [Lachnospiraceae bacterium]
MIIKISLKEDQKSDFSEVGAIECNGFRKSSPHSASLLSTLKKAAIKNALDVADKFGTRDKSVFANLIKEKISSFLNKKIEEYGLKIEIGDVNIEKHGEDSFWVNIPVEEINYGKTVVKLLPLISEKIKEEKHNIIFNIVKIIPEEKRIKIINSVFEILDDSDVENILVTVTENNNAKICEEPNKLLKKADLGYEVERLILEI